MLLNWKTIEGYAKPQPLDTSSSPTTVYLHKNIKQVPTLDEEGKKTGYHYRYDEAMLTLEEYSRYREEMENPATVELMQSVSDIQAEMEIQSIAGEINNETIMQTLSDIQADIALI